MTDEADRERLEAWAAVVDDANYYEILGILELADDAAIKEAFHQFALAFHPDSHAGAPEGVIALARDVYRRGAEAYRVLADPRLRAEYDLVLARGLLRLGSGGPVPEQPRHGSHLQSLEDLCQSPAARLCASRANALISGGDLRAARAELQKALQHDDFANQALEDRIDALDEAIFAMGG